MEPAQLSPDQLLNQIQLDMVVEPIPLLRRGRVGARRNEVLPQEQTMLKSSPS